MNHLYSRFATKTITLLEKYLFMFMYIVYTLHYIDQLAALSREYFLKRGFIIIRFVPSVYRGHIIS